MACAAALAVQEVIEEENLLTQCRDNGHTLSVLLRQRLAHPRPEHYRAVRGPRCPDSAPGGPRAPGRLLQVLFASPTTGAAPSRGQGAGHGPHERDGADDPGRQRGVALLQRRIILPQPGCRPR